MHPVLDACQDLPERRLAGGETLLTEGERSAGTLYVLVEGEVEVLKAGVRVARVGDPGAMFGEQSILLDIHHTATVRAVGPVRCLVAEDGAGFLTANPAVMLAVSRLLARRLHLATTYLADLKRQYADANPSLGMVHDVLGTLVHHQEEPECEPGSDREREPNC